jgi:hypothetical protein
LLDYLPFWAAIFVDRTILILVPVAVVLIPLIRSIPWIYSWRNRRKFYHWYVTRRDSNQNGLCEWGGEAELESVRDARVVIWDKVGWPSNFEGPDVNSMLVAEAKALGEMARILEAAGFDALHVEGAVIGGLVDVGDPRELAPAVHDLLEQGQMVVHRSVGKIKELENAVERAVVLTK